MAYNLVSLASKEIMESVYHANYYLWAFMVPILLYIYLWGQVVSRVAGIWDSHSGDFYLGYLYQYEDDLF